MTGRVFVRGDGPGRATGTPPTLAEIRGNGWAVGEWTGETLAWRSGADMVAAGGSHWSRLVTILPQSLVDVLPWSGYATPTPPPPDPVDTVAFRAEDMTLVGNGPGATDFGVKTDNPDFQGDGYLGWWWKRGEVASQEIYRKTGGLTTFTLRYANGTGRAVDYRVNGTTVTFPATGGWGQWAPLKIVLSVPKGESVFTMEPVADGAGIDFDGCILIEDGNTIPPTPPPPPPVIPSGRKQFGLMGVWDTSDVDDLAYMHMPSSRVEVFIGNDGTVGTGAGNLPWTLDAVINALAAKGLSLHPLFNNYEVLPADGATRFAAGVVAWVKRYGKGGTFWAGRTDYGATGGEMFNEFWADWWARGGNTPPDLYTAYVRAARIALDAAGLGWFKLFWSSAGNGYRGFDDGCVAAGILDLNDVGVSIHPYDNGAPSPTGWRAQVDYALAKFPGKEIYCTEHGYHADQTGRRQWIPDQIREVLANPRIVGIQFFEVHDGNEAWRWKGDQALMDAVRSTLIAAGY